MRFIRGKRRSAPTTRTDPQFYPPNYSFPLRYRTLRDSPVIAMGVTRKSAGLIRRTAAPALAFLIVGTFAGHAIAGPNGLLAWGGYQGLTVLRIETVAVDPGAKDGFAGLVRRFRP